MKFTWTRFAAAALLAAVGTTATAPAEAGNAVATVVKTIPANSDVRLSIPVTKPVSATTTLTGVSGAELTCSADVSIYGGGLYYARVMSGDAAGLWVTITSADGSVLTVADENVADELEAGVTIRIYEHMTVGDILPAKLRGFSYDTGSEIQVFDNTSSSIGVNPGSSATTTFTTGFIPGQGVVTFWNNAGLDQILPPDATIIYRNGSANTYTFAMAGKAPDYPVAYLITPGVSDDLLLGTGFPKDLTLDDLVISGQLGRQVLGYNPAAGFNAGSDEDATWASGFIPGQGVVQFWNNTGGALALPAGEGFTLRVSSEASTILRVAPQY